MTETLKLDFNFAFADLFEPKKLAALDQQFLMHLNKVDAALACQLQAYRDHTDTFDSKASSELIIAIAPIVENFIAKLFQIEKALEISKLKTLSNDPIFIFKNYYILREVKKFLHKESTLKEFSELNTWLESFLEKTTDQELAVASFACQLLEKPEENAPAIENMLQWCVHCLQNVEAKKIVKGWVSFHLPQKLDYECLVPMVPVKNDSIGRFQAAEDQLRHREGFKLTDAGMSQREVLSEIHYCVYCHKNQGDFCSKGFPLKKNQPELGLKKNPFNEILTGCPLEEKISEMHWLKKAGHTIAALVTIMIDNPMCPATGHRICNDCMKACIYQKQDPVNIPQAETGILSDVLALPWGVEIYDLLTRWNPLRPKQYVAKTYNGLKVLVMGMGPAGFSLAHHLLMEGFAVVGADGLKIEPLPTHLIKNPIKNYQNICENLDERIMAGFGGVAEYGITVRWDKNFLKLIYLSLCRRPYFQVFGNVRFGGTLLVEDAWDLGFDHMAIAVGAGLPKALPIPGSMAPGMRQANDFLMALQLTGAEKFSSLANLQLRLPAVVIGGGLTGVDAATEAQAYYITQIEKTALRYETLVERLGEAKIRKQFSALDLAILEEFLDHAKQLQLERDRAKKAKREPDLIGLIRSWGGVSIVYRGRLQDSPAYQRNHEEVREAMREGIYYAEALEPIKVMLDDLGQVKTLQCRSRIYDSARGFQLSDQITDIPARAILVATGAKPNIAYEFEHRGTFHREGMEYQCYDEVNGELKIVHPHEKNCKIANFGPFTSYQQADKRVTFLGDTHPVFHGSVVKAIASGKRIYPEILKILQPKINQAPKDDYLVFHARMQELFSATVNDIVRKTPSVIELTIHAPQAAKNFKPGQFYRLQNYETDAKIIENTLLQTEATALLAAEVDPIRGDIQFMVTEQGVSTKLFATLKKNQPVALMGPTGTRVKVPKDGETIMLVGDDLSIAFLRAIAPAWRAAGNRVLYVAYLKSKAALYCQTQLESITDHILWVTQTDEKINSHRAQDLSFTGDLVAALKKYADTASHTADKSFIRFASINRVIVVGDKHLVQTMNRARLFDLKDFWPKPPIMSASIYGPMQCMLKGVCAQCLQWQIDPDTGQRTKAVFACSWQDQPIEIVDIGNLVERLAQNSMQETLSQLWLDDIFRQHQIDKV